MRHVTNAAMYLRVSLDDTGEEQAVSRQREDCTKIIRQRGWTLIGEYVDNSISASSAAKVRPEYDRLVRDYAAGKFGALVCWDLDRLTRQPRQLEDWIDAAQDRGLLIVTANGEADLTTDAGILFAGIKAQVARAEVKRKGARQARAQQQRAEQGRPAKGIRPTGYTLAGEIIPEEAKIVRRIFDRFTRGETLKGIAADLERDGVPTRRGGHWSSSSVSSILRNARYAGRSVYKGQDVGQGMWKPIVAQAQFSAAQARLDDPRRKTRGESTARKHLGSGLYFCSCGLRVRSISTSGGGKGANRYACRNACYYRSARPVDEYVLATIRGRLAMPDLQGALARPVDRTALAALASQRKEISLRRERFEADYDSGLIDGRRFHAAVGKADAQLDQIRAQEARLLAAAGPTAVLGANNPVAAFDRAPLAIQQQTIDALARVTLLRGVHGSRVFRPESVVWEWRSE
ncbi:recombinase family protein [Propionibacterium freudenreichii]|nr:recombinase family protein [Propionibacterium freudenreichii]MDK9665582.1 recombinase family protein [Propionibacterium freudenreichii]